MPPVLANLFQREGIIAEIKIRVLNNNMLHGIFGMHVLGELWHSNEIPLEQKSKFTVTKTNVFNLVSSYSLLIQHNDSTQHAFKVLHRLIINYKLIIIQISYIQYSVHDFQ
jgi:hypothetical protein